MKHDTRKLPDHEKQYFAIRAASILHEVGGEVDISEPVVVECLSRDDNGQTENWTSYLYDVKIIGTLGDLTVTTGFDDDEHMNKVLSHTAWYIAYKYWSELDSNLESPLAACLFK